jgi:hypothetical protein
MCDDDQLMTLPRMARHLGVTQQWLRSAAEAGRIPHLRAGQKRLLFAVAATRRAVCEMASGDNPAEATR